MNVNMLLPQTRAQLLQAMRGQSFVFGAGFTDLIIDLQKQERPGVTIINLGRLKDAQFTSIALSGRHPRIGALCTAAALLANGAVRKQYPVLHEAAAVVGSAQIRQVATIGGNVCTASPSGDMACALVALGAECDILAADGSSRSLPLEKFFKGPKKNALKKNEVLRSLRLPANRPCLKIRSGYVKVGTRRSMDCSVVSIAYHLQIDKEGIIKVAGLAIGSAAPTIVRPQRAEAFLAGKNIASLGDRQREAFAEALVSATAPIDDSRASAWYRREVVRNLSQAIIAAQ